MLKHTETLYSMAEEGSDKAFVTRYTADKNAEVVMANAEANAAMALANAELTATQQERSGDLAYESGQIGGQLAMIQGVTSAISGGMQAYSMAGGNFTFLSNQFKTNSWSGSTGYRTIGPAGTGGVSP